MVVKEIPMKTRLLMFVVLCVASGAFAADRDVPDAARREISRRGYLVQKIETEIDESAADALAQAFALPDDDSHKFTLTILYGAFRNRQLDNLKRDLLTAKELEPWVRCKDRGRGSYNVESSSESHLHCRFDQHQNPFLPEQWAGIKVLDYPTLLLQPPRSGQWGPPSTVINQRTGYDGDPAKLAEWIRASIGKYALAWSRQKQAVNIGHGDDSAAAVRYPAPFSVPPQELPAGNDPPSPFPPDLAPMIAEPLTAEQIKKIVPEADDAFVTSQVNAKVTSAAEILSAWSVRQVQSQLQKLVDKPPPADPHPLLNWLIGSGVLMLAAHMALSYFGVYSKTTPTPVDDLAVQIAGKLLDAIEQKKRTASADANLKQAA
jgi:hypothetical protein